MRTKYVALTLILLVIAAVAFTGSISSVIGNGPGTALHTTAAVFIYPPGAAHEKVYSSFSPITGPVFTLYAGVESSYLKIPHVSRARSQVYQNENRSTILKFIAENPGFKMLDISKSLGMNLGTLRYHLMILDVNHLVTTYQDGEKHVRYFTNNGAYGEDRMKVISLLRREPTSRLLGALAGQTGMTSARIVLASGLPYSDVNRYLKELMAKGVVLREPAGGKRYQYRIAPDLEEFITGCM